MSEKNLNFDKIIDRRNTKSLKFDFAVKRGKPADVLPLWVADMDFQVSSYIQEALAKANEHGIFGYSDTLEDYNQVVKEWYKRRYDWKVESDWLIKTPGIVFALAMAVKAYTKENEAVLIQPPVYYPFTEVIEDNNRKLVANTLVEDENGKFQIDFEDFENKIVENNVKLFLLCSPHNPISRVWSKEELTKLADICLKHNVVIVSDEIHADFAFARKHVALASIKEEYNDIVITCTSPSKSFNIAGLQISNIVIANDELRRKFNKQIAAAGYSQVGLPGIIACEAAYKYGDEWLDAVRSYIYANYEFTKEYLEEKLPEVKALELEGTYLLFLDFRKYDLTDEQINDLIINKAKLWLDGGAIFGKVGEGFQRINLACPRATLTEALNRIANTFKDQPLH